MVHAHCKDNEDMEFHFFDPSDDTSISALKGKAVHLSIEACATHVREADIHALLLELQDEELTGCNQEFDSITYAKGMCNQIQCHPNTPEVDVSNIWKPNDHEVPTDDAEVSKDTSTMDPKDLKDISPLEPSDDSNLENDNLGESLPTQTPPDATDPSDPPDPDMPALIPHHEDIPPPVTAPEPLEQDQVLQKFARALPDVNDPAALHPRLGHNFEEHHSTCKEVVQLPHGQAPQSWLQMALRPPD
jgi:hypothetical protein